MVEIILFITILAIAFFIYLKNKQDNRTIERRNRLAEKQEELIQRLTSTKDKKENTDNE
jgi:cbb3-type cytochrome oxidase subunit 3